jgi:5-(carboxyamino)imidazole ribonucleotide mutase
MPCNGQSRKVVEFASLEVPVPYNPPLRRAPNQRNQLRDMPNSRPPGRPLVGIIMGSRSDWPTLQAATAILTELKVPFESRVVSAHRTPDRLYEYAKGAANRGLKVIIAGAGGAAHLPGMTASMTVLPVLGVPVESRALKGLDSLLSIAQMPGGIPVATFAIGESGAKNAGLFAAALLANEDAALRARLERWRKRQTRSVPRHPEDSEKKKR